MGPDWDRELKFGGWARWLGRKIKAYWEGPKDSDKTMILLRKSLVVGAGFEPAALGYEYSEKNDFHQYLYGLEGSGANSLAVGCQLRKVPTPDQAGFERLPQAD